MAITTTSTHGDAGAPLDAERFTGSAMEPAGIVIDAPIRVPVERYISPAFAELESERLWPKTWVVACTVDHVAAAGDFFELRLGWDSVLVVRGDDGELRAFQNVCRHRGNPLCQGSGSGLSELRCGYHRWAWDLKGKLREVPSRKGFGVLHNDELGLFPVQVDTWGPLVFVNLDMDAPSLAEHLEGVPADIAWARPQDYRCTVTTTTPVECNWKVVSEGFSETYHIQGLHREMLATIDDVNSAQRFWGRQGVSYQPYGVPSPRLGRNVSDQAVWDAFVMTQGNRMGSDFEPGGPRSGTVPEVPAGKTLQDVIAEHIRTHQASLGVDLGEFDTEQVMCLSQYNLFPNTTVLVTADMFTVLTARPGSGPDQAELVLLHLERAADVDAPRSKPIDVTVATEQASFGFVLDQDLEMLARMQRGLHQRGFDEVVLSREECRIINMHRHLEAQLGLPPSGRVPDAGATATSVHVR